MTPILLGALIAFATLLWVLAPLRTSTRAVASERARSSGCETCGPRPESDAVYCSTCGARLVSGRSDPDAAAPR